MSVREAGQGLYFFRLVKRAHLGGLGDGYHLGLNVMLIADSVIRRLHGIECQLAIGGGDGNELAASEFFGSAALVGIDVRGFGADHRVIGLGERLQTEHVGGGAVEDKKDFYLPTEMLPELSDCGGGVRVIAITDDVALVGGCDRFQNGRVNSGVIVAGKAACGLHGVDNVTAWSATVAKEVGDQRRCAVRNTTKGHYRRNLTRLLLLIRLFHLGTSCQAFYSSFTQDMVVC